MTTTITIKTRARGATVKTDDGEHTMGANQEHRINTDDSTSVTVTQNAEEDTSTGEMPLDPNDVPGRKQNDELLKKTPQPKTNDLNKIG